MEENRPTRRRWFQFSLRTFLVVITLVGTGGGWVGMQLQQKRRHEAVVNEILNLGGDVRVSGDRSIPAWKEWMCGSYAVKGVELDLHRTDNTDSLLSQTVGMNLVYVDLVSTDVTDAGLAHLEGMTSLKKLFLGYTHITDAGLAHLKGLTGLEELYLQNTQITDVGMANLQGMSRLQTLSLENTQVTGTGLKNLSGLIGLESLYLDNTQTTDAGLAYLKDMINLETLDLDNTLVTDTGVNRLQQAMSSCWITYSTFGTASAPTSP